MSEDIDGTLLQVCSSIDQKRLTLQIIVVLYVYPTYMSTACDQVFEA